MSRSHFLYVYICVLFSSRLCLLHHFNFPCMVMALDPEVVGELQVWEGKFMY